MPTDPSEIQGELLALRCLLAALLTALPMGVQLRAWPAFDHHAELLRDLLAGPALAGFDRAATSLKSRQPISRGASGLPSTAPDPLPATPCGVS